MLKTTQAFLFCSCLCFVLFLANATSAQYQIAEPDIGDGAFEKVADKMEKLLQLKWKGDGIVLNRDWDERKKKKKKKKATKEEELEEVIEQMVEQGVPEDHARRLAEMQVLRGRDLGGGFGRHRSEVEKAFFAISSGGSSGSSRSGERRRLTFSNGTITGTAFILNEDFKFVFEETDSPRRSFEVRDTGEGQFKFTFAHDEHFLRFLQTEEGTVQLIWIDGGEANAYVAENFSEFINEHPQPTNNLLLPVLERLGIKMPMGKTDPLVLSAALAHLERMQVNADEQVAKLLKDLDSSSFKVRQAASEKLAEGYEGWAGQIENQLADSSVSPEAKLRLKKIVNNSEKSEIVLFMEEHRSLETPSFLVKLLEFAEDDQKSVVLEQLRKVTGEDNGESLDAWKASLVESSEK